LEDALGLIWAESRNNPNAENWNYGRRKIPNPATGKAEWKYVKVSWDRGFLQHNQSCVADFALRYNGGKLYDPANWRDNLRIGLKHFAVCKRETGSRFGAVAAMNMGIRGYKEWVDGKREMKYSTKRLLEEVFN